MSDRLIIVSNRLPFSIELKEGICDDDEDMFEFSQSSGGLVSGLMPLMERENTLWLGWADTRKMTLDKIQQEELVYEFRKKNCVPVFLEPDEVTSYYDGFSNSAIWPLFHYFPQYCDFEENDLAGYRHVNKIFCDVLAETAEPGDMIWIHDYHLMLLPELVRDRIPDISIGFFLHIPFPSYEMFRILPSRAEILRGLLGADLIGFHTYDYARHFLSSCHRILGIENQYGTMVVDDRPVQADSFPLGIDYDLYSRVAGDENVKKRAADYAEETVKGGKVILSIERLDYSKGILNSLSAYGSFLESHPEWIEKVVLTLIVVPSRENVESYHDLKSQVDEMVGAIEGKFSTQGWSPIDYYYRSFPLENICTSYRASDVMLVGPLRDGMNLISKEYLAAHDDDAGVLILSEMAGSVYELSDAVIVNPFNRKEYVDAIEKALTMPEEEQKKRNQIMQTRLKQYTSMQWAEIFVDALQKGITENVSTTTRLMDKTLEISLLRDFTKADRRAIVLDYDGTLVGFKKDPDEAYPDERLRRILAQLSGNNRNDVVILSGRDKETLEKWFGDIALDLISEHGIWQYRHDVGSWTMNQMLDTGWKKSIRTQLENFVIRTPGSFIEEKNYSLVWHCRGATDELGERRMREISAALSLEAESKGLMILQGSKVVEIKPQSINKGRAAFGWLQERKPGFIFAAGDDTTDEDMFHVMPETAWTVKVGQAATEARFYVESYKDIRQILDQLV